jgi:hypothetical protein
MSQSTVMRFRYVIYCILSEVGTAGGINQVGTPIIQKMVAVQGSPCAPTHLILIVNTEGPLRTAVNMVMDQLSAS